MTEEIRKEKGFTAFFVSRRMTMICVIWVAIGFVVYFGAYVALQGWSPDILGIAFSPERTYAYLGLNLVFHTGLAVTFIHLFWRHPEWRAPRGRYVKGREYPFFSAYNLVGAALVAACMIGSGWVCTEWFDAPMLFAMIFTFYFGSWIAPLGCATSIFFRTLIYWGGTVPGAIAGSLNEWWSFCAQGFFYYWLIEPRRGKGVSLLPYYVAAVFTTNLWHHLYYPFMYVLWNYPQPVMWTQQVYLFFTYRLINTFVTTPPALIAAESAIRVVTRGRKR